MFMVNFDSLGTSGCRVGKRLLRRIKAVGGVSNLFTLAEDTDRIYQSDKEQTLTRFNQTIDLSITGEGQVLAFNAIRRNPSGYHELLGRTDASRVDPIDDPTRGLNRQPRNALIAVRAATERWEQAMQAQLQHLRGAEDAFHVIVGTGASTTFRGGFITRALDYFDLLEENQLPPTLRAVIFTTEGLSLGEDRERMLKTQFAFAQELDSLAQGSTYERPHQSESRRRWTQGVPVKWTYIVSGRKAHINAESFETVLDSEGDAIFYEIAVPEFHRALESQRMILSSYIGEKDGFNKIAWASAKGFGVIDPLERQLRYYTVSYLIALTLEELVGTKTIPVQPQPSSLPDRLAEQVAARIEKIILRISQYLQQSHWGLWAAQVETTLNEIETVRQRAPDDLKRTSVSLLRGEQRQIADTTRLALKHGIQAASLYLSKLLLLYEKQLSDMSDVPSADKQPIRNELRNVLNVLTRKHVLFNKKKTRAKIIELVRAIVVDIPKQASHEVVRELLTRQMRFITDLKDQVDTALSVAKATTDLALASAKMALPNPKELWTNPKDEPQTFDSVVKTFMTENSFRQIADSVTTQENIENLKGELIDQAAKPEFQDIEKREQRQEMFEIELPLPLAHCLELGCHSPSTLFEVASRIVESKEFLHGLAQVDYQQHLNQVSPTDEEKVKLFKYLKRVSAYSSLIRQEYRIDDDAVPLRSFRVLLVPEWLNPKTRELLVEKVFGEQIEIITYSGNAIIAAEEVIGVPLHAFIHFGKTLKEVVSESEDLTSYYTDACFPILPYLPDEYGLPYLPADQLVGVALASGALEMEKDDQAGKLNIFYHNGEGEKIVLSEGLTDDLVAALDNGHRLPLIAKIKECFAFSNRTPQKFYQDMIVNIDSNCRLLSRDLLEGIFNQFFTSSSALTF